MPLRSPTPSPFAVLKGAGIDLVDDAVLPPGLGRHGFLVAMMKARRPTGGQFANSAGRSVVPRLRAPRPCGTRRPVQGCRLASEDDGVPAARQQPSRKPRRRYPVGAEVTDGGVAFRVWAPKRRHVAVVIEDGGEHAAAWRASRTATSPASCPERRPAPATASGSTATRRSIPIRPRASSPRARTGRRRSSIPPRSAGRTRAGAASRSHGQVIYELHVGTFTPRGHLGGGGRASCRGWRTSASR